MSKVHHRIGIAAGLSCIAATLLWSVSASAQVAMPTVTVSMSDAQGPEQVVPALKILGLLTILSLAPAILISVTAFTRVLIVLSFARQAIGAQNVPPTQVMTSLALMITAVIMAPVASRVNTEAYEPYVQKKMTELQAYEATRVVVSDFLLAQTRQDDLQLFYDLSKAELPNEPDDVSLHLLIPSFMISELRTGFEMGFLLFLPFVMVDLIVGSLLTAMGMVMLPPTMISTPLKILLFVLVDGWALITKSIVGSFSL